MSPDEPQIFVPGVYQAPSGMYLPSTLSRAEAVDVPAGVLDEPGMLVAGRPPSFLDQVFAYGTEEEFGLGVTLGEAIVAALGDIPFWPAFRALARYQRDLWPVRVDQVGQLELLHRWYGTGSVFVERAESFLRRSPQNMLFSEQQLFGLQKLLILHAADGDSDAELSEGEYLALVMALAAVPGSILRTPEAEELAQENASLEVGDMRWLRMFLGHGGLIGTGSLKHEIARAHHLYEVLAKAEWGLSHRDACPLEDWLVKAYGLSFSELQAFGFALHVGSKIDDTDTTPVLVGANYFTTTKLAHNAEAGLKALSADRDWYRTIFQRTADDPRRLAFEITPFLQRPAIRHPGDKVMPIAPRALEVWLGASGAYYRLFDAAKNIGSKERKRFSRFNGYLTETHARAVVMAAHEAPESAALWVAGRVHGDFPYRVAEGEARTPDIVIDLGHDLVLIEVTGSRPTEKSLVDAEPEAIRKDINKLLEDKVRQLADRIQDLRVGIAEIPGVAIDSVERIWPIVVSSEGLFQTPSLWAHLRDDVLSSLDQSRVQPLTLFDLEDLERLMGLVQQSHALAEMLASKTQPGWRDREFATWHEVEGQAFGGPESAYVDRLFLAATDSVAAALFTQTQRDEYHGRAEANGD